MVNLFEDLSSTKWSWYHIMDLVIWLSYKRSYSLISLSDRVIWPCGYNGIQFSGQESHEQGFIY